MPANSADNSAILALPYIQPSQSQKHVTHNEAISTLDVLVQLVVAGFGATNPPADPAPGDVHALGATPTGAWAGQDNTLATWHDGAWAFITPLAGWRAWGVSEAELRIWDGTAWGLPTVGMDNLDGVGINTTADATNRLSVSAPATLLSHEGAGHQLKINKAGTADTASLLFQSGWTGHAEMGLSGGTDFAIKVSEDGTTWNEAMVFEGASGTATGAAVQSSASDAAVGKLMTVGAFGLGASTGPAITDADSATKGGIYAIADLSTATNIPSALTSGPASLLVLTGLNASNLTQIISDQNGAGVFIRQYCASVWKNWEKVLLLQGNGDLNIGSGTLFVDASTNRIGFGTTAPGSKVHISKADGVGSGLRVSNTDGEKVDMYFTNGSAISNFNIAYSGTGGADIVIQADGDVSLAASSGARVGIGASPNHKFHVHNTDDVNSGYFKAAHASFTANVIVANSTLAASNTFDFLETQSGNGADIEHRLKGDGNATCDGSWTGGGADYAEYFEWVDGNPIAEDRRGISVVLVGDQIREAVVGEEPIGVISGNPSVVGDAAPFRWKGKYMRDEFGSAIMEDYEVVSWVESVTETETETEQATVAQEYTEKVVEIINGAAVQKVVTKTRDVPLFDEYPLNEEASNDVGIHREPRIIEVTRETTKEVKHSYAADEVPAGITVPAGAARVTQTRRKLNPDYVEGTDYTPREDRPEWDTVGLVGKLRLRTGQVTDAGWVKMRDVSDGIEEWLVR